MPPSIQPVPHSIKAFSLIELMTVMAILSILAVSVSYVGMSDKTSANVNHSLISLTGYLELARQTALSGNTYTYVALSTAADGSSYIALFESPSGVDEVKSGVAKVSPPTVRMLANVIKLNRVTIPTSPPSANLPSLPSNALSPSSGTLPPIMVENSPVGPLTFDRVIKFTPQGLALIYDETPVEWVKLVIVPQQGASSTAKEIQQASAISIAGLTGRVFVHRPGEE